MTKSLDTQLASTQCSLDKAAANDTALNASVTRTFLFSRPHTALSVYFADATSEWLASVKLFNSMINKRLRTQSILTGDSWGRAGPPCCKHRRQGSRTFRWQCPQMRWFLGSLPVCTLNSGCRAQGSSNPPADNRGVKSDRQCKDSALPRPLSHLLKIAYNHTLSLITKAGHCHVKKLENKNYLQSHHR